MSATSIPQSLLCSQEIRIYKNFEKSDIALKLFGLQQSRHAHVHIIRIMCSKFQLEDLKPVGGV